MDNIDNIPVYSDMDFKLDNTSSIVQFNKILEVINQFGIPLSLNQALLLLDYEDKAVFKISTLYLEITKGGEGENSSDFYINTEFDTETIKETMKDDRFLYHEFEVLQHELRLINEIKQANKQLTTGGCNNGKTR